MEDCSTLGGDKDDCCACKADGEEEVLGCDVEPECASAIGTCLSEDTRNLQSVDEECCGCNYGEVTDCSGAENVEECCVCTDGSADGCEVDECAEFT